ILLASLLGLGVLRQVIIAVGKAQSALGNVRHLHSRAVQVGRRAEQEQSGDTQRVQVGDRFDQLIFAGDGSNAIQLRLDRSSAFSVAPSFIHARLVHVADFLHHGAALGIVGRCLFQNGVQYLAIVFRQFVEPAPTRLIRRNGIVFAPVPASVLVEVLARVGGFVDGAQVEGFGPGDRGLARGSSRRGGGRARFGAHSIWCDGAGLCRRGERSKENNG